MLHLPLEVMESVLFHLDARSLARLSASCYCLFYGTANPIVTSLKARAMATGRKCPVELPHRTLSLATYLAWAEFRYSQARKPVAAGDDCFFFIRDHQLMKCETDTQAASNTNQRHSHLSNTEHTNRVYEPIHTAVALMQQVNFVGVTTGVGFGVAISTAGDVYTWGNGRCSGCLGYKRTHNTSVPTFVQALAGVKVRSVSASQHCIAVAETGEVFSWGRELEGACGHGRNWITSTSLPRKIESLTGIRARNAFAGGGHSLVLTEEGEVYTFGRGHNGQLGHGNEYDSHLPIIVSGLQYVRIITAAAGETNSIAVADDGSVFSWGSTGVDHTAMTTPRKIDALDGYRVISVESAREERCAISSSGEVFSWSTEHSQELSQQPIPLQVDTLKGEYVVSVSLWSKHNLALTHDGSILRWGKRDQTR